MEREHQDKFFCQLCKMEFISNSELKEHINSLHIGEERFSCMFCNLGFPYTRELTDHLLAAHSKYNISKVHNDEQENIQDHNNVINLIVDKITSGQSRNTSPSTPPTVQFDKEGAEPDTGGSTKQLSNGPRLCHPYKRKLTEHLLAAHGKMSSAEPESDPLALDGGHVGTENEVEDEIREKPHLSKFKVAHSEIFKQGKKE